MKKIVAMLLALGMTIGMLTGCGSTATEPAAEENTEAVELTVFAAASMTETLTEIA